MTDGELARVLDDHLAAEFQHLDLDATMATMTAGIGRDEVREFYGGFFIGHWPADTTTEQISRTVGADHVVDELVMSFTHDMVMNAVLPGVPAHRAAGAARGLCGGGVRRRQAHP